MNQRFQTRTETVTVRLPKGMADKVRAASGMGLSPLVRKMLEQFLTRHQADQGLGETPSPAAGR